MLRPLGGYTVIEVMIVLAVTGLLLAVTIVAVGGQQAHAEFTSGMNDLNSKVQTTFSDVNNGFSGSLSAAAASASNYDCVLDPSDGSPKLVNPGGNGNARGANPSCIFLGKVLQFSTAQPDNNRITIYSVLGRRTYNPGCSGCTETTVDSLLAGNPVAAIFPVPPTAPQIDLTEDYIIPSGIRINSIQTTDTSGNTQGNPGASRMFGIFNSFNSENTASSANNIENGGLSLLTVQYPLSSNFGPRAPEVVSCIKLKFGNCRIVPDPNLWPMNTMKICFESTRNDDTAVLTINSSNGLGASTKLTFEGCAF
jgi:hypothetical protein